MASFEDFTTEELMQKLRNADSAGDTVAAQRFADVIKARQAGSDVPGIVEVSQPEPEPESGLYDKWLGGAEAALTVGTGATGGTLGYMTGAIEGITRRFIEEGFTPEDASRMAQERAAQFTYIPRSEEGKDIVGAIGEATEWIPPVMGLAPSQMQAIGQNLKAVAPIARGAIKSADDIVDMIPQSSKKQAIAKKIQSGDIDTDTIGYSIDAPEQPSVQVSPPYDSGKLLPDLSDIDVDVIPDEQIKQVAARVVTNPAEKFAQRIGVDDRTIIRIKRANNATKTKMNKMLNIHRRGLKNPEFGDRTRASRVAGESLLERVKYLDNVKSDAGKRLDSVALSLKGKPANFDPAMNRFRESLARLGVTFDENTGIIDFSESQLRGTGGASSRRLIRDIFEDASRGNGLDAYRGHQFKKFLDIETDIGKQTTSKPLAKDVVNAAKRLRHDIDDILDSSFPAYDDVNTRYKTTLEAIDSFDKLMPSEMTTKDLRAADSLGTLMRRVYGNPQTRDPLINAIDELNRVSEMYGGKFNDDPIALGAFANSLDNHLGRLQETSIGADISKGSADAARMATAAATAGKSEIPQGAQRIFDRFMPDRSEQMGKAFEQLLRQSRDNATD